MKATLDTVMAEVLLLKEAIAALEKKLEVPTVLPAKPYRDPNIVSK